MPTYRLTFDVYNSHHSEFPPQRISLERAGFSAKNARYGIATIYVSKDGSIVNTEGKVGADGYYYPEWTLVRQRKIKD